MRGCGAEEKRCMIVDMFEERKMDVLALCETKVKGQGVREWEGQRVIVSGVAERCRAREGVAIMVSGRLWGKVKEYKCVSSRIVWVRLNVAGEKVVIVSVYGPGMEKNESERESFWQSLNECLSGFGESERLVVLGDLNAKVGDRERGSVVGKYGVPGVNENGESLMEMCLERELIVGNTWFPKKDINKYTWERENGEERSLLDYVLVQRRWKSKLLDVMVRRGVAGGMSDHYLVEAKVRIGFVRGGRSENVNESVVKTSEFDKKEVRIAYKEKMDERWARVRDTEVEGVYEEYAKFSDGVKESAGSVCGYRRVGRGNKNSRWWDEEMRGLVKEKRELYEVQLQDKRDVSVHAYRMKGREVKKKVRQKKKAANEKVGVNLSKYFVENKKLFYREVNAERKVKEQMDFRIKDVNGEMLSEESEVLSRWSEYFEVLLNVEDRREAEMNDIEVEGVDRRLRMLIEVTEEDVRRAIKRLKNGKSPGVDGITSEMLRYGGESVVEWLTRVCKVCLDEGRVPKEWVRGIIVPLYKGKGDRGDCKNYRGITLLSIPGKVYGRVLIEKVRRMTESLIGEEQCGFRQGRGCVDQVFVVKQLCEKFESKGKKMYVAYMDLEKAYDRIDREAMWRVLRMYGVDGKLLRGIKSFYDESEACVRVCRRESDWFSVKVGLRQGCVMSPWMFNMFMDGVMREVRESGMDVGVKLWDRRLGCEWRVEWLMFADDTVLVGDSEEKLQRLVKEFESVCKKRKLKVNVSKSKVMKVNGKQGDREMNVSMEGGRMEEVGSYKYLGVNVTEDGKMKEEVSHRIGEARRVAGCVQKIWKRSGVSMEAKVGMYERIVEPTLLYGSEVWMLNTNERKKVEAVENNCLRSICGVRRIERVRNVEVRRRSGKSVSIGEKMDQSVLRWFGHVERMEDDRLVKRVYDSEVMGGRRRGRPRKCWIDGVKEVLERKGLSMEEARECVQDRGEWRSVCKGGRRAAGEPPV